MTLTLTIDELRALLGVRRQPRSGQTQRQRLRRFNAYKVLIDGKALNGRINRN